MCILSQCNILFSYSEKISNFVTIKRGPLKTRRILVLRNEWQLVCLYYHQFRFDLFERTSKLISVAWLSRQNQHWVSFHARPSVNPSSTRWTPRSSWASIRVNSALELKNEITVTLKWVHHSTVRSLSLCSCLDKKSDMLINNLADVSITFDDPNCQNSFMPSSTL